MSILKSIVSSIKSSFSNEAFEQIKMNELRTKLTDAIHEASSDGTITADEMSEIKSIAKQLGLSDTDMSHVKRDVLKNLVAHILEDGKVTEDEMALLNEVEDGLQVVEGDKEQLEADMQKVKDLYGQNK